MAAKKAPAPVATVRMIETLQFERDLFEKKLHRMHDRYDAQDRKLTWIFAHPLRFVVGRFYHLYIKRDQKL